MNISKKPKIIVYDLDDTLYENTWAVFNPLMGVKTEDNVGLYKKRKKGQINQQEWLDALYKIYAQDKSRLKKEHMLSLTKSFVKKESTDHIIEYLKKNGFKQYLLSGGIDIIVEEIAKDLGIIYLDGSIKTIFDQNNILRGFKAEPDEAKFKLRKIIELKESLGCKPEDIICFGDGENEEEIFKYTKRGITFTGSKIKDIAWKEINEISELEGLL